MKATPEQRARALLVRMLDRKALGLADAVRALVAGAVYIGGQLETLASLGVSEHSQQATEPSPVVVACVACNRLDTRPHDSAAPLGFRAAPCGECGGQMVNAPRRVTPTGD